MKDRPDRIHGPESSHQLGLFILGKEDTRIQIEIAIQQASIPNRCEVNIISNVGHMGYIEDNKYALNTIEFIAEKCFAD